MSEAPDLRNQALFSAHAKPGVVGLAGGAHFIDRTIRKVQRHWRGNAPRSLYSAAMHPAACIRMRLFAQACARMGSIGYLSQIWNYATNKSA